MSLCGAGIWLNPVTPPPSAGTWDQTLIGAKMLDAGALCSSDSSSCPAHGSVPAVLQRKAPLPPLCIMTNQGRQAAVPLAHHSTVSLPWESNLSEPSCTPCCRRGYRHVEMARSPLQLINKLRNRDAVSLEVNN